MQLIDQISEDTYDPTMFEDEEKKRILAAIDEKIAGKQIVATEPRRAAAERRQVIDLMEALRASLGKRGAGQGKAAPAKAAERRGRRRPRRPRSARASSARAKVAKRPPPRPRARGRKK